MNPSDITREGYKWVFVGDVIDYIHAFNQSKRGQKIQFNKTVIQSPIKRIEYQYIEAK